MKKKIKDLEEWECEGICVKHTFCRNCPLNNTYQCIYSHNRDEVEVEVDE